MACMEQEFGAPITIGDDVWIGGGAILLPGIKIGRGCVIGAGSVVVCLLFVHIGFANIIACRQKTYPTALSLLETQPESSSLCDYMLQCFGKDIKTRSSELGMGVLCSLLEAVEDGPLLQCDT